MEQHGSISLIGKDGIIVMRQPYDVRTIGRDIGKVATFQRFQVEALQSCFGFRCVGASI
uniref:Uncharacterized protein n=1 Tax=Burkholderia orbicola (strain AU 1054) TaxID=331271 RepID=A0A0H2XNP8_BURO1